MSERLSRQQIRSLIWLCTTRKGFYFLFEKHAVSFKLSNLVPIHLTLFHFNISEPALNYGLFSLL